MIDCCLALMVQASRRSWATPESAQCAYNTADLEGKGACVPPIEAVGLELRSRDELHHRYFRPFRGTPRDIHVHVCHVGSRPAPVESRPTAGSAAGFRPEGWMPACLPGCEAGRRRLHRRRVPEGEGSVNQLLLSASTSRSMRSSTLPVFGRPRPAS